MAEVQVSMGDVLGNAGTPPTIVAGDKTYTVGWPTFKAKSRLEDLVINKATESVLALKGVLPPSSFAEVWNTHVSQLQSRAFRLDGSVSMGIINTRDGNVLFTLSLFREHHPDMTEKECRKLIEDYPEQVSAAIVRVTPRFLELVARELGGDPVVAMKHFQDALSSRLEETTTPS